MKFKLVWEEVTTDRLEKTIEADNADAAVDEVIKLMDWVSEGDRKKMISRSDFDIDFIKVDKVS